MTALISEDRLKVLVAATKLIQEWYDVESCKLCELKKNAAKFTIKDPSHPAHAESVAYDKLAWVSGDLGPGEPYMPDPRLTLAKIGVAVAYVSGALAVLRMINVEIPRGEHRNSGTNNIV